MKWKMQIGMVFLLVILVTMSFSQSTTTGVIEGKVLDVEGTPLPGVEIILSSPNMIGGNKNLVTDERGSFRFRGLQPGVYSTTAQLSGFKPKMRTAIRLFAGQTLNVTIALEIGGLEEEITVVAEAPLIDVRDSQTGTATMDEQVLNNIIFSRSAYPYSTIALAPGVDGNRSYGSAGRVTNAYVMDGTEVSFPQSGASWAIMDHHIFSETVVQGLGAPAEYDGFKGVVLSMITKSGGNTFDGMIDVDYKHWTWQSVNIDMDDPQYSLYSEPDKQRLFDAHFSLGGPIFRDKLWLFVAWKYEINSHDYGGPKQDHLKQPKYFIKATWQPSPKLRLSFSNTSHDFISDQGNLSVPRPVDATNYEYAPDRVLSMDILYTFSDKTFSETKIGSPRQTSYMGGYAGGYPGKDVSGRYDASTGMYSVNWSDYWGLEAYRLNFVEAVSHHADEFIKGSHDFKVGVEYEHLGIRNEYSYNGGIYYHDNVYNAIDKQFHTYGYSYGYNRIATGARMSVFVQDSWRVSDRLTINPGVRYSSYSGKIKDIGSDPVMETSALSPRIGFSFDVFGDGTTAVKGHYGRFNDKLSSMLWEPASGNVDDYVGYEIMPDGTRVEIFRFKESNPAVVDPDIKMTTIDQITLGVERMLARNISLSATFVYKKWSNQWAKIPDNYTSELVDFTIVDDQGVEHALTAYNKTSWAAGDTYVIKNPTIDDGFVAAEPMKNYYGLMLQFEKRFSDNWMLNGSYTYSRITEVQVQPGGSWGITGRDPNLQMNYLWDGEPVPYNVHLFKIYGTFILPLDISVSPMISIRNGDKWTRQVRAPVSGRGVYVNIEKLYSQTLPGQFNIDMRVEKSFRVAEGFQAALYIDAYNLLNSGRPTSVITDVLSTNFGFASYVNQGRAFKIGVRFYY